ncbi:phosphopantetheine-binding protein [Actinokineospora sp.]|uniref:phosphopantetheine-binding protein n=1 Tax=Actinokineospora sp. TaxID=1872133 RepID=UPI004037B801
MSAAVVTRAEILAVIQGNITKVVEGARGTEISPEASLKDDFGADSLEIVEVVSRSMKELKVKVPRTELSKAANIGELVDIFERFAAA